MSHWKPSIHTYDFTASDTETHNVGNCPKYAKSIQKQQPEISQMLTSISKQNTESQAPLTPFSWPCPFYKAQLHSIMTPIPQSTDSNKHPRESHRKQYWDTLNA